MTQKFIQGNVPVNEAAKILGKEPQFVRLGLIKGFLPIGNAFKMPNSTRYTYYISPKLLYEYTGILYEKKANE